MVLKQFWHPKNARFNFDTNIDSKSLKIYNKILLKIHFMTALLKLILFFINM